MFAVFTVDSLQDNTTGGDGLTTLREAIVAANAATGPDTIDFAASLTENGPATIGLSLGELPISDDLTVNGPGTDLLTIDAQHNSRVFTVNSGVGASIYGLTIAGGITANDGAGIYALGDLALYSVRITGNNAPRFGGGIYADGHLIVDSSIVDHNSSDGDGGGIFIGGDAYATLTHSTIDYNEANYGAGVFGGFGAGNRLTIDSSTISYNVCVGEWSAGGGVLIQAGGSGAVATVQNSTISHNSARVGGGLRGDWYDPHLDVINSTIAFNQGDYGGGVQLAYASTATLYNTIVAENTNLAGTSDNDIWSTLDSASSYNLLGRGGSGGLTNSTNGNIVLSTGQTAGLAPLGEYGGPTKTHALLVGSAALDAGNDNLAVDGDGAPFESDQRGHQRPFDLEGIGNDGSDTVDIGAFEAGNPTTLTVNTTDDELDDINAQDFDFGDLSLREALAIAASRAGGEDIDLKNVYGEINLQFGELDIQDSVTYHEVPPNVGNPEPTQVPVPDHISIFGPGADSLTINAHDESRVFHIDPVSDIWISGLTITHGYTTGNGGAVLAEGDLTLSSDIISSSQATDGGGIYAGRYVETDFGTQFECVNLSISDTAITNNSAISTTSFNGNGGGVWGGVNATGTVFDSNHADGFGGGIYGGTNLSSTIISHNSAKNYGGVFYGDNSRIVNSTIAYNTGEQGVGGVGRASHNGLYGPFLPPTIVNSTIVFNDAGTGTGGGIDGGDWPTILINSIVANNTSGGGTNRDDVIGVFSSNNNLIGSVGDSTGLDVSSSQWGTDNDYLDPGLIALSDIGGPPNTFALAPNSAAIDAGDDNAVAAQDLVFDQMGEGFKRILGEHVDIGANEAHVIQQGDTVYVFGTELDDNIDMGPNGVTLDRIGTIGFDGGTVTQMNVDSGDGGDDLNVSSDVGYTVSDANHPGNDDEASSTPVIDFDPGRLSFANFPLNPYLDVVSANNDWVGCTFGVAWKASLRNFLDDPEAIGPHWLNTQIAIVQIDKSTLDVDSWPGVEEIIENHSTFDWRIDAHSPSFFPPQPKEMVYPINNYTFQGGTILDFTKQTNGILSEEDAPGLPGYGYWTFVPYRTRHLRQEFETYVIGLEGTNGVKLQTFAAGGGSVASVWQGVKKVTVYGGVKWYQDFVWDDTQNQPVYVWQKDITDTTGQPTEHFRTALRNFLNYSYP